MSIATIRVVLDVAAALDQEQLGGHLYMIDDQRLKGSQNQATDHLSTAVSSGDTIIWSIAPIECEVHADIQSIKIPPEVCEVERRFYPNTSISYWVGSVKAAAGGQFPYELVLEVGSEHHVMSNSGPSLSVAHPAESAPPAPAS
jgi:hypothetical protein